MRLATAVDCIQYTAIQLLAQIRTFVCSHFCMFALLRIVPGSVVIDDEEEVTVTKSITVVILKI